MSRIVTFYSYKGGVGRTFALANMSVLLARRGKRVLVIDWDLEAPGLHRYFQPHLPVGSLPEKGLIHLLHEAMNSPAAEWQPFVAEAQIEGSGTVSLIYSGDQSADYVERVRSFSWTHFFENRQGGSILKRWRSEWKKSFDFVLVDSRTGITDSGEVCTILLPDVLVLVFSANAQSFERGKQIALGVQEARRNLTESRPPVAILPLPSRFDGRDEVDEAARWLDRFATELKPFYDDWLPARFEPRQILELTKIPYVTKFSFGEPLPVITHGISDPDSPGFYLDRVARLLASDFAEASQILTPDRTEPSSEFHVFISHNSKEKAAVRELKRLLSASGLAVWLDEDELRPGIAWHDLLETGIKSSRSVAVLIGKDGIGPWEDVEMQAALRLSVGEKRPVIPVLLPGAPAQPKLPSFLGKRTWVDLRSGYSGDGIAKLVWGITGQKPGKLSSQVGVTSRPPESVQKLRRPYLNWLLQECAPLKLRAIDQGASRAGYEPLALTSVYVDVNLDIRIPAKLSLQQFLQSLLSPQQSMRREAMEADFTEPGNELRLVSALEALATHDRLVVLGTPGSGKSTFSNYVALSLADAAFKKSKTLNRLGKWWKFGPLLPVRVSLRQFAASLPPNVTQARASHLWDFLQTELASCGLSEETGPYLRSVAMKDGAMFLLDGLDEAPDVRTRARVLEALSEFTRTTGQKSRFLLTARPYAWEELTAKDSERTARSGFSTAYRIADFDIAQIDTFITRWYQAAQTSDWLTSAEASEKAASLRQVVERGDLLVFARNPLLLTLIATLHSNRGRLPDDRADLYDEVVNLLLQRWNETSGSDRGLLETLAIPTLKLSDLREVIQQLAFEAHAAHAAMGTASIPETALVSGLRPVLGGSADKAELALAYIENRAGLLVCQRESGHQRMYMFPHRVFQEYLAACHLAGRADFYQRAADLAREFPGHWRAVLVLAARHARAGRGVPAADALVHACSVDEWSRQNTPSESDWQAAVVAGEQLLEIGVASVESRAEHRAVRDRVVGWLAATIQQSTLSARERAQAGIVLARLGDPRPGVSVKNGLPDVDWVEIPRGPFVMGARDGENGGNEHPQFKCNLIQQPYRISRYPITVAQYQAFVEANGYETERYWTKAGWRWRRKAQVTGPEGNDVGFQVANHPRVGVSWFEAVAFCRWLGEKLKLDVRLPTEAEWERAARHSDGRIFPWGDEMDVAQRCNMEQTGMGQTCTVGTFPSGNAACGASDMAGNVFEWCCTVWLHNYKGYEKKATDELEFEGTRVLRGGAWASRLEDVRCVSRIFCTPDERKPVIGFRVVAPPIAAR